MLVLCSVLLCSVLSSVLSSELFLHFSLGPSSSLLTKLDSGVNIDTGGDIVGEFGQISGSGTEFGPSCRHYFTFAQELLPCQSDLLQKFSSCIIIGCLAPARGRGRRERERVSLTARTHKDPERITRSRKAQWNTCQC